MIKYAILVALVIGSLGGAYFAGRKSVKPEVVKEVVAGETKVVDRIVTVTKVVKPDGTVMEVTKTEDKNESTKTSSTVVAPIAEAKPDYSLGLNYRPVWKEITQHQWDAWEVEAGRRMLGDIWLQGTIAPLKKEVSVGVRYEF